MLSKQYRLKSSSDIKNVLASGKSTRSGFLFLKFFPNKLNVTRFAFSIGMALSKNATERNAIKRKLRAIVGGNLDQIEKGYDCVFFVRSNKNNQNNYPIDVHVINCLVSAKLLKNK